MADIGGISKETRAALKMDEYSYDVLRVSKAVFTLLNKILKSSMPSSSSEMKDAKNLEAKLREQPALDQFYYLRFKEMQLLHKMLRKVEEVEQGSC